MAYILSNSRNIESTNILQWAHGIELNGQEKTTTEEEESENANGEEAGGIEFMKEPPPKLVLPVSSFFGALQLFVICNDIKIKISGINFIYCLRILFALMCLIASR